MATITPTVARIGDEALLITWASMSNGDVGAPATFFDFADRSVQITGTFGGCDIQGSNDGTNYAILTDPQGNALTVNSAKIEQISELTQFIRPNCNVVGSTITVTLFMRRAARG